MTTKSERIGVIYHKTNIDQLTSAAIVLSAYGIAGDALEISATTQANVASAIAAWSALTYDRIIINTVFDAGGNYKVAYTDFDVMIGKLKASSITAIRVTPFKAVATCPVQTGGSTTKIIFDAGASGVNDFYNGYVWHSIAGASAGDYRFIYDYDGAGKFALLSTATSGTVDDTTTFEILDFSEYITRWNTADANGKLCQIKTWDMIHTGNGVPLAVKIPAHWKWCYSYGQAQAASGTGLQLINSVNAADIFGQTEHDTVDVYNNKWAYIYSSTNGKGLIKQISDYDGANNNCVVSTWSATPTGTIIYGIVEREWQILLDAYLKMYIMCYLTDLTNTSVLFNWKKLIDDKNELATEGGIGTPKANPTFWNEVIAAGKEMYKAYTSGVTTP